MIKSTKIKSLNDLRSCTDNVINKNTDLNVGEFGLFPDKELLIVIRQANGTVLSLPYFLNSLTDEQMTLSQAVPDSLKFISTEKDLVSVLTAFVHPNANPHTHYSFYHTHNDLLWETTSFGYWIKQALIRMFSRVRKDARPNVVVCNVGGWPELQFFRIG